jgi:hypothetical protein
LRAHLAGLSIHRTVAVPRTAWKPMKNVVAIKLTGLGTGALMLLGAVASAALLYLAWRIDPTLADENHLFENAQVACLLLGALLNVHRATCLPSHPETPARILSVLLAFLCLGCALRELDIDDLGDRRYFEPLETGLRALALGGLGLYLLRHLTHLWAVCVFILRARGASLVHLSLLGILLYVASWPLDKKVFALDVNASLWLEEMLELYACCMFLAAAYSDRRRWTLMPA